MNSNFFPTNSEGYRIVELADEQEVILGHKFSAFYRATVSGSAGTCIIAMKTNLAKTCMANFSVEVDKSGMYELYEAAIISGGSVLTSFNNNRNSSIVASCIVYGDPSVATVGTFIGSHVIGSTTGGASKSGGSANVNRYELRLNTSYLLKFTADSDNTRVTHGVYWRECQV